MDWIETSKFDLNLTKVNFVFDFLLPNGYLPFGYNKYTFPINVLEHFKSNYIDDLYSSDSIKTKGTIFNSDLGDFSKFEEKPSTDFTQSIILRNKKTNIISTNKLENNFNKDEIYLVVFETPKFNTMFQLYSDNNFSIDKMISPKLLELAKKYENIKFIFADVWEGAYEHSIIFLEKLNSFLNKYNINHKNKIIVTTNNNLITKLNSNDIFEKNFKNRILVYANNWLVLSAGKSLYEVNFGKKNLLENNYQHSVQTELHFNNREKYYLMYNRNSERLHRAYFVNKLYENNLIDKGFISFFKNQDLENYLDNNSEEENTEIIYDELGLTFDDLNKIKNNLNNYYPMYIEETNAERVGILHNYLSRSDEYKKTYFSLVSETNAESKYCFITEKTMKPILNLHPFLILGNPYTLKYIKSLGFKTFDKWWDESYDNELDFKKRSNMVLEIVKNLCEKPKEELNNIIKEMSDILTFNQMHPKSIYDKKIFEKQLFMNLQKNKSLI